MDPPARIVARISNRIASVVKNVIILIIRKLTTFVNRLIIWKLIII